MNSTSLLVPIGFCPVPRREDPSERERMEKHRERMSIVRPVVDAVKPEPFGLPHLATRAKQDQMNLMRQMEIDRGNSALVERVSHLMQHKIMDDNAEDMQVLAERLVRCRQSAKDFRAEKIQRENESLSRRIENAYSLYSREKLKKEMDRHKLAKQGVPVPWALRTRASESSGSLRRTPEAGLGSTGAASTSTLRPHASLADRRISATQPRRSSTGPNLVVFPGGTKAAPPSPITVPGGGGGGGSGAGGGGIGHRPRGRPAVESTSGDEDGEDMSLYGARSTAFRSLEDTSAAAGDLHVLPARTLKYIGRDVVLNSCRRKLRDPTKKDGPEELWDVSVVEVGHLSLTQDDLMSGLRVDAVRVADKVPFSMKLDIENLKTLSERFHKKAHMALLRARRRPDSKDASIVAYTRLSHLDSKGADAVGACR